MKCSLDKFQLLIYLIIKSQTDFVIDVYSTDVEWYLAYFKPIIFIFTDALAGCFRDLLIGFASLSAFCHYFLELTDVKIPNLLVIGILTNQLFHFRLKPGFIPPQRFRYSLVFKSVLFPVHLT